MKVRDCHVCEGGTPSGIVDGDSRPWAVVIAHWLYMLDAGVKFMAIVVALGLQLPGSMLQFDLRPLALGMVVTALFATVEVWTAVLLWRGTRLGGWLALVLAGLSLVTPAIVLVRDGADADIPLVSAAWIAALVVSSVASWNHLSRPRD